MLAIKGRASQPAKLVVPASKGRGSQPAKPGVQTTTVRGNSPADHGVPATTASSSQPASQPVKHAAPSTLGRSSQPSKSFRAGAGRASQPAKPAVPQARRSIKTVEFVGGDSRDDALETSSLPGGFRLKGEGDVPSSLPSRKLTRDELTDVIDVVYAKYQFMPDPDSARPYIYPSRGNCNGVIWPKVYYRGYRYNYQGYNVGSQELRFQCMSVKVSGKW